MHPLSEDLDHVLVHTRDLWEEMRGARIFITGGTGFVGTWLVESLLWASNRLKLEIELFLLTRHPDAFCAKAPEAAQHPSVTLVTGDAATFPFPPGVFLYVLHAATERQFEPTPDRPTGMYDADVAATRRVLEFARTHGTQRFLFTSSGAAYGRQPANVTHLAEDYVGAPGSTDTQTAYGQAKHTGEWLSTMYGRQYGFDVLLPRLFAFVGPHLPLDVNFAVGNFIRDVLRGGPVRVGGDGTPYRSYLYAADLAIWLWTILVRGRAALVYNVGSPEAVTIAELAHTVVRATVPEARVEIARQAVPGAPASRYVPSTARAAEEFGLRPLVTLEEGIRRTWQWNRS